jgi:predicted membrane channel-forming protein YqfA (hemolysin III family)
VDANARLTGAAGIVILILLIAELVTVVLGAASVLSLHVAIGLILVPPVLVKLASTTWGMVNYYLGAAAYGHRGPRPTLPRVLGPILILAIVLVLLSGVALLLGPSSDQSSEGSWSSTRCISWRNAGRKCRIAMCFPTGVLPNRVRLRSRLAWSHGWRVGHVRLVLARPTRASSK